MKVDGVGVRALIHERDPYTIPLGRARRWSRHLADCKSMREEDARSDLDFAIDHNQFMLPKQRAVGAQALAVEPGSPLFRQVKKFHVRRNMG